MKHFWRLTLIPIILVLAFAATSYGEPSCAQKPHELIAIRHGCRLDTSSTSPLSQEGFEQAAELIDRLRKEKIHNIDAIFTSNETRTKQTARPVAECKGLESESEDDIPELVNKICSEYSGKTVLYVGHSDTLDQFIKYFLSSEEYQEAEAKIKKTNCGEGWVISFLDGNGGIRSLTKSDVKCNPGTTCRTSP